MSLFKQPNEIQTKIFQYLHFIDLLNVNQLCKSINKLLDKINIPNCNISKLSSGLTSFKNIKTTELNSLNYFRSLHKYNTIQINDVPTFVMNKKHIDEKNGCVLIQIWKDYIAHYSPAGIDVWYLNRKTNKLELIDSFNEILNIASNMNSGNFAWPYFLCCCYSINDNRIESYVLLINIQTKKTTKFKDISFLEYNDITHEYLLLSRNHITNNIYIKYKIINDNITPCDELYNELYKHTDEIKSYYFEKFKIRIELDRLGICMGFNENNLLLWSISLKELTSYYSGSYFCDINPLYPLICIRCNDGDFWSTYHLIDIITGKLANPKKLTGNNSDFNFGIIGKGFLYCSGSLALDYWTLVKNRTINCNFDTIEDRDKILKPDIVIGYGLMVYHDKKNIYVRSFY
jgi:hypothetical protein